MFYMFPSPSILLYFFFLRPYSAQFFYSRIPVTVIPSLERLLWAGPINDIRKGDSRIFTVTAWPMFVQVSCSAPVKTLNGIFFGWECWRILCTCDSRSWGVRLKRENKVEILLATLETGSGESSGEMECFYGSGGGGCGGVDVVTGCTDGRKNSGRIEASSASHTAWKFPMCAPLGGKGYMLHTHAATVAA